MTGVQTCALPISLYLPADDDDPRSVTRSSTSLRYPTSADREDSVAAAHRQKNCQLDERDAGHMRVWGRGRDRVHALLLFLLLNLIDGELHLLVRVRLQVLNSVMGPRCGEGGRSDDAKEEGVKVEEARRRLYARGQTSELEEDGVQVWEGRERAQRG